MKIYLVIKSEYKEDDYYLGAFRKREDAEKCFEKAKQKKLERDPSCPWYSIGLHIKELELQ